MKAEIIVIGTELLMAETADTNSSWLANQLLSLGIELRWVTVVGDDTELLTEAIGRAFKRSDCTVTTGGMGPTEDDITRESICNVVDETATIDPELLGTLQNYFKERHVEMPAPNIKQATIIPSAHPLPNPRGTAPGWWISKSGHIIIALPGPPSELQHMWKHEVHPRLLQLSHDSVILTRTLKTIGLSEASVDEIVQPLYGTKNPYLGVYAKPDGIYLRIISQAETNEKAAPPLKAMEASIRAKLEPYIWGTDQETPEVTAGQLLMKHNLTLATMETCTGGLLAETITGVDESLSYFIGGIVLYANRSIENFLLDVAAVRTHGVASHETAKAMAIAASHQLSADVGIGVTGVPGPSALTEDQFGTIYIGISHPDGTTSTRHVFPPRRELVKGRAVTTALLELCRVLSNKE